MCTDMCATAHTYTYVYIHVYMCEYMDDHKVRQHGSSNSVCWLMCWSFVKSARQQVGRTSLRHQLLGVSGGSTFEEGLGNLQVG